MSKWRPSPECIFVISDIHGKFKSLKLILNRILPLRPNDKIIFLGDYIDRGNDSFKVVEEIISLKEKYNKQIICLLGNHEELLIKSLFNNMDNDRLELWLDNGGYKTIYSYALGVGIDSEDIKSLSFERFKSLIPKNHISFFSSLFLYHEDDSYIYVHAGCDPNISLSENDDNVLIWDRSLLKFVVNSIFNNKQLNFNKTVVCGHGHVGPIVNEKYLMIDMTFYDKVTCVELNSLEACYAEEDKKRMVKFSLSETTPLKIISNPRLKGMLNG